MIRQWIIFSFIFFMLSFSARAEGLEGLSLQYFIQGLSSELNLKDDTDGREVNLKPEAPGFHGIGVGYQGFGASYQWTGTSREDRLKRSDADGVKWTIPWKHFLFEAYITEYEGVAVEGSSFRQDIEVFSQGAIITWSRWKDLDFSTIFGLETNLSKGEKEGVSHTFFNVSIQESIWRGDTGFVPISTGNDDFLDFRYIRRRFTKFGIGRTYVKYFTYGRVSLIGSIGPFIGKRLLKYEAASNLSENEETEKGLAASVGFSLASDIGFRRLGKRWGTNFNYGLNFYAHNAASFGDQSIGTNQLATEIYLGALW